MAGNRAGEERASLLSGKSSGQALRLLTVLGLTVALSLVALGAVVLWDARRDAWRQASQSAENLSLEMEREIARTFNVYDLSLQGSIEALAQPEIEALSPAMRHYAVFDRAASADYLGSLLALDQDGNIIADSTSLTPHRLNLAERDYFKAQRDHPNTGLFLSRPFRSRLREGDPSIAISRRLRDADGQFRGVVVGTLKLAYFEDMFSRLQLDPDSTILLERADGRMVVRQPGSIDDIDHDYSGSPLNIAFQESPTGSFTSHSVIDGVDRLVTYRQVGTLPLVLAVSTSVRSIYAKWWQKSVGIGAILLLLSGTTVVLMLLVRREMLRRLRAETALMDAAGRLEIMAATDGLTGLANRRSFEAELAVEWRRAVRSETTMALLMLDADWFKPFKDRYGHVEGDEVLRRIASCIELTIRRPGDLGARYGGEEFVALLPETDLTGALSIAERICAGVSSLGMPHDDSPLRRVTVSIGVAIARPGLGDSAMDLVRDADLALYAAKRGGRARVCTTVMPARENVPFTVVGPVAAE